MMIKNGNYRVFLKYLFTALLVFCMVFSCKSNPPAPEKDEDISSSTEVPAQDAEVSASETEEEESPIPATEEGSAEDESDIAVFDEQSREPPEPAPDLPLIAPEPDVFQNMEKSDFPEPEPEPEPLVPEAPTPDLSIPELPAPEPLPPVPEPLPPVLEPFPPVPTTEPVSPAPEPLPLAPEPLPPVPELVPPPAPREPPLAPPYLRPAEPVIPPPVREPVPAPPEEDHVLPLPSVPLPALPGRILPETSEGEIVFSRVVRATVGQIVEVPFRGTGWVYLGELGNRRGMVYDSRRLDLIAGAVEGQSFIFRAEAAGTYILKFYKQDFIQDYIINDHVQVIVGEADFSRPGQYVDSGRVIAEPRWPSPDGSAGTVPAAEQSSVIEKSSASEQRPASEQSSASEPEPASEIKSAQVPDNDNDPAEFVRRARQEYDAGRVEPALNILDTMLLRFPQGTDEALWLCGQLLEANSPARDIRLALEYYRRLVREYPQSPRVPEAQRRIAYLERYYFNIR